MEVKYTTTVKCKFRKSIKLEHTVTYKDGVVSINVKRLK